MSNSLNRTSLELVNVEGNIKRGKKKNRPKSVLDLIPANYKIVNKKKQSELSLSSYQYSKCNGHKNKKKVVLNKDSTEENIQRLLLLSSNHIDQNVAEKLFNRAVKKRPIFQEKKPEEEERTAFTDEDFKNFAAEYLKN